MNLPICLFHAGQMSDLPCIFFIILPSMAFALIFVGNSIDEFIKIMIAFPSSAENHQEPSRRIHISFHIFRRAFQIAKSLIVCALISGNGILTVSPVIKDTPLPSSEDDIIFLLHTLLFPEDKSKQTGERNGWLHSCIGIRPFFAS